jgi:magnesium transporter
MAIHWITQKSIQQRRVEDLPELLAREDGMVWVDIPTCDEHAYKILANIFHCHPLAIRDCREYNLVPKVHSYAEHLFIILHSLELQGNNRLLRAELDQFIGTRYLVTIHTPPDEFAPLTVGLTETKAILARIETGHWYPKNPVELSFAIVSAISRHLEGFLSTLRTKVGLLEHMVISATNRNSEKELEEMFNLRHQLLTVKTMANQSKEIYARAVTLAHRSLTAQEYLYLEDLLDQFTRIQSMSDGEKEFLQGIIDFYQTRTTTKMNIAMERLALLTSLLLPVTAVSSIYGMNIIVNDHTDIIHLVVVLLILFFLTVYMFRWAKKHGWWQ